MATHPTLKDQPPIIVVTGIQAAGKSTVARLLAQRFARGVHIEADVLQHMIVSGAEWVGEPGEPEGEAARQLRLRLQHMCLLGRSFHEAGFAVALDDIIIGDRWQQLTTELRGVPVSLVVLAPRAEVVAQQRDVSRAKRPLGEAWAHYLDRALRTTMVGIGYWIDTTEQTPEQTVDQIMRWLETELGGPAPATTPHVKKGGDMTEQSISDSETCYIEQFPHALPHREDTTKLRPCGHHACDPHTITYYGTGDEDDMREGDYCMVCYEHTFPGMCPDRTLRAAVSAQ